MAVIEYDIHFGNGKPYVTTKIMEVGPGDTIRFKSNKDGAGIEYQGGSPFSAPNAPQADKPFLVGKSGTPDFPVARRLTAADRLLFQCGTYPSGVVGPHTVHLEDAYAGDGTPPPDLAKGSSVGGGHGH